MTFRELATTDMFRILQTLFLCTMLMLSMYNIGHMHGIKKGVNLCITKVINPLYEQLYEQFDLGPQWELIK